MRTARIRADVIVLRRGANQAFLLAFIISGDFPRARAPVPRGLETINPSRLKRSLLTCLAARG